MNTQSNPFTQRGAIPVSQAEPSTRAAFIRRTYAHLAGAVLAFIAIEAALLSMPGIERIAATMVNNWFMVVILFLGGSWFANHLAHSAASTTVQYAGLIGFVLIEAAIFLPLLWFASTYYPSVIPQAAAITLLLFGGLSATVFITRKDFSFMGATLTLFTFVMLGVGLGGMFFGFNLGLAFSAGFIMIACGWILFDTSNILHHYDESRHVAASLALFSSLALLFWYVIRILIALSSSD